jgi:hypothetical protein
MAAKRNASGLTPALHRPSLDNEELVSRGTRFFDFFGISYSLQLIGKTNSKTKVAKVFFFIFMSSYTEMSILN